MWSTLLLFDGKTSKGSGAEKQLSRKINRMLDFNINSVKFPNNIPDPLGFNINFVDTSDPKVKLREVSEVKSNVFFIFY